MPKLEQRVERLEARTTADGELAILVRFINPGDMAVVSELLLGVGKELKWLEVGHENA